MIINSSICCSKQNKNLGFKGAFTDKELEIYQAKFQKARKDYEIPDAVSGKKEKLNNTAMILPDFYCPDKTLNSDDSIKFIKLAKVMNGINVVQALPRGPVTETNLSPFSSSPFEYGEHLINLKKLNAPDLKTAYTDFKALPEDSELKVKFKQFEKDRPYIEKYGMLDALKEEYGTDYFHNWQGEKSDLDKNLFNYEEKDEIPPENKARQEEIKTNHADTINFYKFKQFIGYQQQQETKSKINNEGMKFFGDCLIGFSYRDEWAFKPAFEEGKTLGAVDTIKASEVHTLNENDQYMLNELEEDQKPEDQTATVFRNWGNPCLDFNKINNEDGSLGIAGQVLKQKFDVFFTDYDGARIDAGWQLSNPVTSTNNPIANSKTGAKPENLGTKLIDVMEMSLKEQESKGHKIDNEDITFENLGGPASAVLLTKNKYPHIHITRYAGGDWGRPAFYNSTYSCKEGEEENPHLETNTGYNLKGFTIGTATHDDPSLIQIEKDNPHHAEMLSDDLNTANTGKNARTMKFAELYTARNQFFTAPDVIGDENRINNPQAPKEEQHKNWTAESPKNYEEFYYKNLSNGKGLNSPQALALAIRTKMGTTQENKETLHFLDKAARILKERQVFTTKEANELEKTNPEALGETLDITPASPAE